MKILLLLFFMCTHAICITSASSIYRKAFDIEAIVKAVKSKCGTDDNLKQFENGFYQLERCVSQSMPDYPGVFNPLEHYQDYCSYLKEGEIRTCLRNFTTNISPCLDENEIYLKKFILDAFDVVYEELCGSNGVSNMQYLYDKVNVTANCIVACGSLFLNYGTCTSKLNIFQELDQGLLNLNKHNLCLDFQPLPKCTTQILEIVCDDEFARFTDLVLRPFLDSCNEVNSTK